MILSCVKRLYDKLGYWVGVNLIARTLRGSKDKRILELHLDELSTYGLMKDRTRSDLHAMIDHLEAEGYLQADREHQTLQLTALASEVLYRGQKVVMKIEVEPEEVSAAATSLAGQEAELFDVLKELRGKLAKEAGVPAYVVFSNATLTDMAKKRPRTKWEFKQVSGVGELKASWYSEAFLEKINQFLDGESE